MWGITMTAWSRSAHLSRNGTSLWHRQSLKWAFLEAKCALGERMYAAGIDDGQLAAQIANLDEIIRQAEAARGSARALRADRKKLVLQLGAAALEEETPLPGADADYQTAREAQAALRAHTELRMKERSLAGMVEPVAVCP
jgi:hypothetical protein